MLGPMILGGEEHDYSIISYSPTLFGISESEILGPTMVVSRGLFVTQRFVVLSGVRPS